MSYRCLSGDIEITDSECIDMIKDIFNGCEKVSYENGDEIITINIWKSPKGHYSFINVEKNKLFYCRVCSPEILKEHLIDYRKYVISQIKTCY